MPSLFIKENKPRAGQKTGVRVIVGVKTAQKATERNRIKRRIRAVMAPLAKTAKKSYVVIVRKEACTLAFEELKREIMKQWQRFSIS